MGAGGKSPLSAFNGSRLLLLKAQVAGDRQVLIMTTSYLPVRCGPGAKSKANSFVGAVEWT